MPGETYTLNTSTNRPTTDLFRNPRRLDMPGIQLGVLVLDLVVEDDVLGQRGVQHRRPADADHVARVLLERGLHAAAGAEAARDHERDVAELRADRLRELEEESLAGARPCVLLQGDRFGRAKEHLRDTDVSSWSSSSR